MADYQIAFNNTTKVATVQSKGDALPNGSIKVGEFTHANVEPAINDLEFDVNHVFFHHVRDALYKRSAANPANLAMFPDNITDMARIKIAIDIDYIALTGITITPATVTLTVASPTAQLGITKSPANASNGNVTWVSSDPTKATVSASGLVTRVANGTTNITATSEDGARTSTRLVTVTA